VLAVHPSIVRVPPKKKPHRCSQCRSTDGDSSVRRGLLVVDDEETDPGNCIGIAAVAGFEGMTAA